MFNFLSKKLGTFIKKSRSCFYSLILLICLSSSAQALVSLGSYSPFFGRYQVNTAGGLNHIMFNPYIAVNTKVGIRDKLLFAPEFGAAFHQEDVDKEYSKTTFVLLYDLAYNFYPSTFVRFGLGNFITHITGDGSAKEQNNGTSIDVFYRPEGLVNSFNTTLNGGLEYYIHRKWSLRGEIHLFGFLNSEKRSFSYIFAGNFFL